MKKSAETELLRQHGEFSEREYALSRAEASISQSLRYAELELSEHNQANAQLQKAKAEAERFRGSASSAEQKRQ